MDSVSVSNGPDASLVQRRYSDGDFFFRIMRRWRLILATQLLDFSLMVLVAALDDLITLGQDGNNGWHYLSAAAVIAFFCSLCFAQARLYQIDALVNESRSAKSMALRVTLIFMALAAIAALTHQQGLFSRVWFAVFYIGTIVALVVERAVVAALLRRWIARGYITQSVVILGVNELAGQLLERFEKHCLGIRIAGVFDDGPVSGSEALALQREMSGAPIYGGMDDLLRFVNANSVDLVVIALPIAEADRITAAIKKLRQLPLNIRILPGAMGLQPFSPIKLERTELPGVQLITVADRPISEIAWLAKGTLDRIAALAGLIVLTPVLLCCAIGIACSSPGPILFRQKRVGYMGREFEILKFRTMTQESSGSVTPTRRSDRRVFKFGGLLRKSSLDELPQLINVLRGDMSLVGPRPHMLGQKVEGRSFFEAVNEYASRHRVKPGITGWAQVNGWRGPAETMEQIERRVEHDIYYIENWSLMLDFLILGQSVFKGFFGKNAF